MAKKSEKKAKPLNKEQMKALEKIRKEMNGVIDSAAGKEPSKKAKAEEKLGGLPRIIDVEAAGKMLDELGFDKKHVDSGAMEGLNGVVCYYLEGAAFRAKDNKRKSIKPSDIIASPV